MGRESSAGARGEGTLRRAKRERREQTEERKASDDERRRSSSLLLTFSFSLSFSYFYLGHVPQVVPGDDRVPSRGQDEELRDHLARSLGNNFEETTTTIDGRSNAFQTFNRLLTASLLFSCFFLLLFNPCAT